MSKIAIPQELRLTPTLKAVIEGGIKHIKKGHIQHAFMKDEETGEQYDAGYFQNGKKPLVCAVGGLQRAAWEACGKPDMSLAENILKVEDLAEKARNRIQLFLPEEEYAYAEDYEQAVEEYQIDLREAEDYPENWENETPVLTDYTRLRHLLTYRDLIDWNDASDIVNVETGKAVAEPKKRVLDVFKAAIGQAPKPKPKLKKKAA